MSKRNAKPKKLRRINREETIRVRYRFEPDAVYRHFWRAEVTIYPDQTSNTALVYMVRMFDRETATVLGAEMQLQLEKLRDEALKTFFAQYPLRADGRM